MVQRSSPGSLHPSYRILRRIALSLALGLPAIGGCLPGCNSAAPAPDAGVVESLAPVPAPEGLLAHGFLPKPDATWGRARVVIGGPAAFFPQSFGGLVATGLGLPMTAAGEIDGDVPALAAIASPAGDNGRARVVAGLHIKVGERFLEQLTKGEAARFTSTIDPATHIALLASKGGPVSSVALGVQGNYLLVAQRQEDLLALGPYVARTMPSLPPPSEDVALEATSQAFAGAGIAKLKSSWAQIKSQAQNGGASVLFGDRVDGLFDVLSDISAARATVVLAGSAVRISAVVKPKAGGGPATKAAAQMAVSDAKALLELPARAHVAVFVHAPASRDGGDPATDFITALAGKDAAPSDREAVAAAVREGREASGEWATFGMSLTNTGPDAFARLPITDEAKATKAFQGALALLKLPSFKARLEDAHLTASDGKTVVENLPGDVLRVRLSRKDRSEDKGAKKTDKPGKGDKKAAAPGETPNTVDLLWLVQKDMAFGGLGIDAKDALRAVVKPESTLGADADVRAAIEGLGSEVAFALLADVPRLVAARSGKLAPQTASPIVLSVGKRGDAAQPDLVLKVDVANAAVQELIRMRSAF